MDIDPVDLRYVKKYLTIPKAAGANKLDLILVYAATAEISPVWLSAIEQVIEETRTYIESLQNQAHTGRMLSWAVNEALHNGEGANDDLETTA